MCACYGQENDRAAERLPGLVRCHHVHELQHELFVRFPRRSLLYVNFVCTRGRLDTYVRVSLHFVPPQTSESESNQTSLNNNELVSAERLTLVAQVWFRTKMSGDIIDETQMVKQISSVDTGDKTNEHLKYEAQPKSESEFLLIRNAVIALCLKIASVLYLIGSVR